MSVQLTLTHDEVEELARIAAARISKAIPEPRIYAIPRGGIPAAYLILSYLNYGLLVESPAEANVFVDDLIDSGSTMQKWTFDFPGVPFIALLDKREPGNADRWVVFPWESQIKSNDDTIVGTITNRLREQKIAFCANDNIAPHLLDGEMELVEAEVERRAESLLRGLLIDVEHDHNTKGTGKRLAKMFCREIFRGRYEAPPKITDFPNAKQLDELYLTGPISIRSSCSHHFCAILGEAWIGVIPGDRVIGLSKFNRVVDWICSRPQIQEELVVQVADFLEKTIKPKGLAVVIRATHSCMTWRGVKESSNAKMTTSVMRGVFREKPEARAEFMALVNKS
jgi:GTP cyclohydrolase IA